MSKCQNKNVTADTIFLEPFPTENLGGCLPALSPLRNLHPNPAHAIDNI